jgi:predicted GIY-YIG superfamily endonuclease
MNISGFQKEYMIYTIKCNVTKKIYVGSTANLTSRIAVHLSSFKQGVITCRSSLVLEGGNYDITVLRDKIQTKEETKKAELNFIDAFGDLCVNKNRPILIDMAEYNKIYQKNYRETHKIQIIVD